MTAPRYRTTITVMSSLCASPAQKAVFKDWLSHRYHAPSDDLAQPVDLSAAAGYEEIVRGLMVAVANDARRPEWKADSFFRRYAHTASVSGAGASGGRGAAPSPAH